jgi:transposase
MESKGSLKKVFDALAIDADNDYAMIDSTLVRAHQHSAGSKKDQAIRNRLNPIPYDKHLYKSRHLIENVFAKLKQYRAIATRYDKTSQNFLGAIHLASAVLWLN